MDRTIAAVQRISTELRPGVLDNLGLVAALQQEARGFQERTGILCFLDAPEQASALPPEMATGVFRIFQETLTNVARHAQANEVKATWAEEEESLVLRVSDNGKGIRPDDLEDPKSLGLVGMQERAELLGGEVTFRPGAKQGTVVTLRIPNPVGFTRAQSKVS